jgi:hypothetical protein
MLTAQAQAMLEIPPIFDQSNQWRQLDRFGARANDRHDPQQKNPFPPTGTSGAIWGDAENAPLAGKNYKDSCNCPVFISFNCGLSVAVVREKRSLNRHRFGQIAGLIHIGAF